MLLGQGLQPRSFDPLAEIAPLENVRTALASLAAEIGARAADTAIPHHEYLARYCQARPDGVVDYRGSKSFPTISQSTNCRGQAVIGPVLVARNPKP